MTAEQMIREALAAGPTPGPWRLQSTNDPHWKRSVIADTNSVAWCGQWQGVAYKDAAYITACHPPAITELLAELDRLREEIECMSRALQAQDTACAEAEADEREACAARAEAEASDPPAESHEYIDGWHDGATKVAAAIRARAPTTTGGGA